ncbi:MAG TPA: hypothetical protein VE959_01055 [Bryobacteraceae bacterium]|nr:hypothetical protein [Bryobacteraceae bacterium]
MPRNFSVGSIRGPRIVMRVIMGVLLAANLVAAVIAFHPFGGSADDLRREAERLTAQLAQSRARLAASDKLVAKVHSARDQGDKFLGLYFMDAGSASAAIVDDLEKMSQEAGIKKGQASFERTPIEGSDTLVMLSTQVGFEGTYANFTKFVNLIDKSPRFLIIESMTASAPQAQGGQQLNVSLRILAFIKDVPGAVS